MWHCASFVKYTPCKKKLYGIRTYNYCIYILPAPQACPPSYTLNSPALTAALMTSTPLNSSYPPQSPFSSLPPQQLASLIDSRSESSPDPVFYSSSPEHTAPTSLLPPTYRGMSAM